MNMSKELLSEVLNLKRIDNIYIEDNLLYFCELNKPINIYELAHKCKEWAWDNGWIVKSGTTKSGFDCEVWGYTFDKRKRLDGESEPEAIFKACQWILDNKDTK